MATWLIALEVLLGTVVVGGVVMGVVILWDVSHTKGRDETMSGR